MSASDNPFKAPIVKLFINSLPVEFALNFVLNKLPMDDSLKEQFLQRLVAELNAAGCSLGEFIFTEENIKAVETLLLLLSEIKGKPKVEDLTIKPIDELEQIEV